MNQERCEPGACMVPQCAQSTLPSGAGRRELNVLPPRCPSVSTCVTETTLKRPRSRRQYGGVRSEMEMRFANVSTCGEA
jgi:hypothetical protein